MLGKNPRIRHENFLYKAKVRDGRQEATKIATAISYLKKQKQVLHIKNKTKQLYYTKKKKKQLLHARRPSRSNRSTHERPNDLLLSEYGLCRLFLFELQGTKNRVRAFIFQQCSKHPL